MSLTKQFIKRLKDRPQPKLEPKFKVGDVIRNSNVDCVAQVIGLFWNSKLDPHGDHADYRLRYFKNPHAEKIVGDAVGLHGSYSRSKRIRSIDAYYELVPEEVAQILYSSKLKENKK